MAKSTSTKRKLKEVDEAKVSDASLRKTKKIKESAPAPIEESESEDIDDEDDVEEADEEVESVQAVAAPAATEDDSEEDLAAEAAIDANGLEGLSLPQTSDDTLGEFASLNLNEKLAKAIQEMGFEKMTKIQTKAIPPLLAGKDVLGAAKTGSGKTISFLVPAIETMMKLRFKVWAYARERIIFADWAASKRNMYDRGLSNERACSSDLWCC